MLLGRHGGLVVLRAEHRCDRRTEGSRAQCSGAEDSGDLHGDACVSRVGVDWDDYALGGGKEEETAGLALFGEGLMPSGRCIWTVQGWRDSGDDMDPEELNG